MKTRTLNMLDIDKWLMAMGQNPGTRFLHSQMNSSSVQSVFFLCWDPPGSVGTSTITLPLNLARKGRAGPRSLQAPIPGAPRQVPAHHLLDRPQPSGCMGFIFPEQQSSRVPKCSLSSV